jgi:dynein heavy chain, axonemal
MIIGILDDIEKKLPNVFDRDEIFKDFPTDYNESMNTVLLQEIIRYNVLISTMKKSIKNLKMALLGKIVMSEEMEKMAGSLFINQVPALWSKVFLSLKPFSSWTLDLLKRIEFFSKWIENKKTPSSFWISGNLIPFILNLFIVRIFISSSILNCGSSKLCKTK